MLASLMGLFQFFFCQILLLLFLCLYFIGCLVFFQEDHEYNKLESSLFLATSRSAWTLGVVWLVWACINGYGCKFCIALYLGKLHQKESLSDPINYVLSLHVFKVLGRISYAMYLLHMGAQYLMSGAAKNPHYFSDFSSVSISQFTWN